MKDSRDRRSLKRIAAGDPAALGDLYDQHAALIAVRLRKAGASPSETEDVLQETFLDVWRCAGSFRGDGAVAAWMWGIAKRKFAMVVRSEVRSRARELAASPNPSGPITEEGTWVTTVDAERALEKLTPDLRSAFEAVVLDGASTGEAADRLGIPEGTVKSRVHRARRALKEEMQ